jgi:transposase InsO family protein
MRRNDVAWAAFRASLLSPILTGEVSKAERTAYFKKLSRQKHRLPNGKLDSISVRTLRRWWKRLREQGIEGLHSKRRSDHGQPRAALRARIERAIELKREQPLRSDRVINQILRREFGCGLPPSTLYRHLRQNGATKRQLGVVSKKIRCRWSRALPNALWLGDFEHGPMVLHEHRPRKTKLSAWIDCHSRLIVEGRYYLHESLDVLVDSLLRAWGRHGTSRELYVDNAKIYHSSPLTLACAQLQIKKLHRPPREPEPGGLIERFFQTVQSQFEAEVAAHATLTLDELNRAFIAWLQSAYHQQVHRGTGQTPHARYYTEQRLLRVTNMAEVYRLFFRREQRTVDLTFSDVVIDRRYYAVDPRLRGMRLIVQWDSFGIDPSQPDEVTLFNEQGVYVGVGRRYERQLGGQSQPPQDPAPTLPGPSVYIQSLLADHDQAHAHSRKAGIDYHSAMARGQLTLAAFGQLVAKLLARPGGLSSFTSEELVALEVFHRAHPQVKASHVRLAFGRAKAGSFSSVLWELQCVLDSLSRGDS